MHSTAAQYYYVNKTSRHKQWSYPDVTAQTEKPKDSETERNGEKISSDDLPEQDGPNPPLPDTPVEKPPPPPPQPEDDGYDVDEDEESPKRCDDGIMMEISEDEKEESTEQETKTPLVSVVSQQPIIYKGLEVSSHSDHIVKNASHISEQQSYSFTHNKGMSVKVKAKKAKGGKKAGKPYKAMSSLVAQWQRAKEEIDEEDRMLEESDEEEKEEMTHIKIAKWKQGQIISGKAVSNPNFEPVPTDWRSRLLEKKKKKV